MKLSERMSRLGTETAFEVLVRARQLEAQGRSVVHLELGEPDFDTPENIKTAARRALGEGWTHYGPSAGLPKLREAIAAEVARTRKIKVEPDQVVVVPGAKPILFFSILALVDPDDEVIYPNPGFPIYESMIRYIGGRPIPYRLLEENDFAPDVNEIVDKINHRTKLIILNSPHNPTGGILTRDDLVAIATAVQKYDAMILSDEVYSRIIYDGEHHSIASLNGLQDRTILLDGFSKTFAMTGWRLGYGVMNRELAVHVARLQTNSTSCTASFSQVAGVEALQGPQDSVDKMVSEFRRRRDFIVKRLNTIEGLSCRLPRGAFYVFPNIKQLGLKSKEMEVRLLEEAGVAALTGTSFGIYGEGYIRFSYANSLENIKLAMDRVEEFVTTRILASKASS